MMGAPNLPELTAKAAELRQVTADLHDMIRACREAGHSLRQLADATGLSHQTISNICNRRRPTA